MTELHRGQNGATQLRRILRSSTSTPATTPTTTTSGQQLARAFVSGGTNSSFVDVTIIVGSSSILAPFPFRRLRLEKLID